MRYRWVSTLFVFILLGLSQAQAQAIGEERSFYVYRLEVNGCASGLNKISTGFRVEGEDGIITALHGVVGCKVIRASSDDIYSDSKGANNRFENLEIMKVDIEHDVALLWRDDLKNDNILAGGLRKYPSDFPKKTEELYVTGYPDGVSKQDFLLELKVTDYGQLTYRIPDNQKLAKEGLSARESPSLRTEVLYLQASVRPGHSGAPLFTSDRQVYGVVSGGLDRGRIGVAWAIRLSDIEWKDVKAKGVAKELERLADPGLASSLSFSSTYPDYELVGVDTQDLPTESVRSYRANTSVFMNGTAQGENVERELYFETSYNADGNLQSVMGADTQYFEQEQQQEAYFIFSDEDHYLSLVQGFQDDCLKLNEIPESIADLVGIPDEVISPSFLEDALTLVSRLGTEEINGEETNHYLLTEPIPLDEAEAGSAEIIGLELWITVDSKQLRKITYEIASTEDSSTVEQSFVGNRYVNIEYSDINTDLAVDLPLACQNVSSAVNVTSALDNGQAMITEPILVEHNVSALEDLGMLIKPTITVDNLAEGPGFAIVRIFDEFGMPLLTYSPETGVLDGIYQAQTTFISPLDAEKFEIFVPYGDLPVGDLSDGVQDLKFRVFVYDILTKAVLAESASSDFSLWQQTDEAGNRNWFSDNYSGLSGITVAGQSEVSPREQDIGNFLSHAFEAETWAYWDEDPAVAEPYFGDNALLSLREDIEGLQRQGLVLNATFEEQNSFIVNIDEIDNNTVEVDVCEFWQAGTTSDRSEQPELEEQWIPQTVTLEKNNDSWWSITDVVVYSNSGLCELELFGLSGLTAVGQTEVSPREQDIGNFLSLAFELETWAYWDEDPSLAEPYFSGNALLSLQESILDLQQQGLVLNAAFDEQNSFIVNTNKIDDNTVEVNVCESWQAGTVSDRSEQPELEDQLIPQTVILEKNSDSWWSITDVDYPDNEMCEFE